MYTSVYKLLLIKNFLLVEKCNDIQRSFITFAFFQITVGYSVYFLYFYFYNFFIIEKYYKITELKSCCLKNKSVYFRGLFF